MKVQEFLEANTKSLEGKCVVISGASGGLGREICRCLATLKAKLILLNREPAKAAKLKKALLSEFPQADLTSFSADFEDTEAVKALCEKLKEFPIDYLIHNAGAYALPRRRSEVGIDNVFQINFLSPYYITKKLLPNLESRRAKIVITGSIAQSGGRADMEDVDYSSRRSAAQVYGNSKRYLMYSHIALISKHPKLSLCIAHPGISPTGITSHYPLPLRALIKLPMRLTFMAPEKACLPIINGMFKETLHYSWLGPRFFNIWGRPALSVLKDSDERETEFIFNTAEELFEKMDK